MIALVCRKEIMAHVLSYKFLVGTLMILILVSLSFFVMIGETHAKLDDHDLVRPKPGDPVALLAPNPLSVFAKGLEDFMTRSFEITVIGIRPISGASEENDVFGFFQTPDFLYVVRVVLSLVALLYAYDQFSRERERGTLRLLMSNPIPRWTVFVGKWLGTMVCLVAPLLLVVAAWLAFLGLDPAMTFEPGWAMRTGLILGLCVVYLASFVSLGMLISSLTRRTNTSMVISLLTWVMLVYFLPYAGTLLARMTVEVPSCEQVQQAKSQIWTSAMVQRLQSRSLSADQGAATEPLTRDTLFQNVHHLQSQVEEQFSRSQDHLARVGKNMNRISPVGSFLFAMTDLAGTGIGEEAFLRRAVRRYRADITADLIQNLGSSDKEVASFHYRRRSLAQVLNEGAWVDMGWICVYSLMVFLAAFFAFVRADVR